MATLENQQPWIPYEMTNDCSQGFCSIYCPQWCYVIFPPPPPFGLSDDDRSSVTSFSPLVIAIIGVLMSVFLLVTYYVVLSKYCGRNLGRRPAGEPDETVGREAGRRPMNGLDEALVDKITVYKYKSGEGMINATDCSVCLGEFREGESLRLLPECEHAFHLRCIDTWLKSHSNCPLCRANIVWVESSVLPAPPPLEPESNPDIGEAVAVVEDVNRGGGEESDLGNEEFRNPVGGGVQPMRRSFSLDSSTQWRVLIDDAMLTNRGSQNPGPMKRSLSSGRFCFTWHGREKSPVLPM